MPSYPELPLQRIEEIEKASLRLVTQAVLDFAPTAAEIFANERDLVADIGEDITREAVDRMGLSRIPIRLFGKIDLKVARYVFHPEYMIRQALFVDSKAEKIEGAGTATIQTAQTSMLIMHTRAGIPQRVQGSLPTWIEKDGETFLTCTIFVKYSYSESIEGFHRLENIKIAGIPNSLLQMVYNPSAEETIWLAGRNAPTLGEAFRVRLSFSALKRKSNWRVQTIRVFPSLIHQWDD